MSDKVIPFPKKLRQEINEERWKALQAEFYLDCYFANKGKPADDPEQLRQWLLEARISAEMENPFFRGWLVRRLSEEHKI